MEGSSGAGVAGINVKTVAAGGAPSTRNLAAGGANRSNSPPPMLGKDDTEERVGVAIVSKLKNKLNMLRDTKEPDELRDRPNRLMVRRAVGFVVLLLSYVNV